MEEWEQKADYNYEKWLEREWHREGIQNERDEARRRERENEFWRKIRLDEERVQSNREHSEKREKTRREEARERERVRQEFRAQLEQEKIAKQDEWRTGASAAKVEAAEISGANAKALEQLRQNFTPQEIEMLFEDYKKRGDFDHNLFLNRLEAQTQSSIMEHMMKQMMELQVWKTKQLFSFLLKRKELDGAQARLMFEKDGTLNDADFDQIDQLIDRKLL